MKIKFYGTRGSMPISNANSIQYGGNTTCLRVDSICFSPGSIFIIDAGTGIKPLCEEALAKNAVNSADIFFTHYHSDHTGGFTGSAFVYNKKIKMRCWGPVENGQGPKEVLETLMQPPYWPVHHKMCFSHLSFHPIEHPDTERVIFHPVFGMKRINVEALERLENSGQYIPVGKSKVPLNECLVVSMHYSEHPQRTISYRLEEKPTRKTMVFLTDHENTDGLPLALRQHAQNADLLVMDCQYNRKVYDQTTAGYGHGTPDYCARFALKVGAKQLALTHHDPNSKDEDIEEILASCRQEVTKHREATDVLNSNKVWLCYDYSEVEYF